MSALRRLHVPADAWVGDVARCEGEVARRILAVWRLRSGDELRVFDGTGREWTARVEGSGRGWASLSRGGPVTPLPEPGIAVTLVCAFPRGQRGDWIVEKATELGVARIVPIAAGRSVLDPGDGRLERWRRIAVEAAEQSGRAVVPEIGGEPPSEARGLVAQPDAPLGMREALRAAVPNVRSLAVWVGPEGGWSEEERAAFSRDGLIEVSLGRRTLRVETAAVVAVAEAIAMAEGPPPGVTA